MPRRRLAFTIVEVILVLAVLVVIAAILWPELRAMQEGDKLSRSVDHLRGLLIGLRARAIEEGRAYVLQIQPGSGSYRVQLASDLGATTPPTATAMTGSVDFDSAALLGEHRLEEGCSFQALYASEAETLESPEAASNAITFHPDGTATDAHFTVVDKLGYSTQLRVRGLTGTVHVAKRGQPSATATAGSGS